MSESQIFFMLNLKTVILLIAVSAVFSLSCSKEDKLPNTIQEMISQDNFCTCFSTVDKYKWKSSIIYYAPMNIFCCGTAEVTSFYNENGEPIHNPEWSSLQQFLDESELIKNIYTCRDKKNNP
jgi:hypothetical protein